MLDFSFYLWYNYYRNYEGIKNLDGFNLKDTFIMVVRTMQRWEELSEQELTNIINNSYTYKEALTKLNYSNYSANNKIIRQIAEKYNLSLSHFKTTTVKDLTGKVFGRLKVLKRDDEKPKGKGKPVYWICQCDCGNIKSILASSLNSGRTESCGCFQKERTSTTNRLNLIGERFGRLIVKEPVPNIKESSGQIRTAYLCQCDCGNEIIVKTLNLRSGDTKSCGCLYSKGEFKIEQILKENNFFFKREQTFDDLLSETGHNMRFDFVIYKDKDCKEINSIIEFQGRQHYEGWDTKSNAKPLDIILKRDKIKEEFCKKNNYKLIIIPYWDYQNITLNYIKERLKNGNDY